jgi:hypothetical protein
MPVLLTVSVLVLLLIVGFGLYVVLRGPGSPPPTNQPTTKPVVATTTTQPPPTTTEPPTTTAEVTTSAPQPFPLPDEAGQLFLTAQTALENNGLAVIEKFEPSATVASGYVTRTDPAANAMVLPGATITVFVSTGPATTAPPATTPPTSSPTAT